jgi:hypothetical protein
MSIHATDYEVEDLGFFDVFTAEWFITSDRDVGRPRLEYFVGRIHQADLLLAPSMMVGIYGFQWGPDFYIPTHYHDVPQVTLVIGGELVFGNRVVGSGAGVYRPAGGAYNFKTGPRGATILEIRHTAKFRTAYKDRDVELVGPNAPVVIDDYTPPKPLPKSFFFDTYGTDFVQQNGFGFGDKSSGMPKELSRKIWFQQLVDGHATGGYDFLRADLEPRVKVPAHHQDVARTLYVMNGSVTVGQTRLDPGNGVYVPPNSVVDLAAGETGVDFVEFRSQPTWNTTWL